MSGPLRSTHIRRSRAVDRVAVVIGAVVPLIVLLLLSTGCVRERDGGGNNGSGAARSPSASQGMGGDSGPAPSQTTGTAPSQTAGPVPSQTAGPAPSRTVGPGASTTPTRSPNAGVPSGAPRTGGGSGAGVRNPVLLAAGIVLLLAAGVLLLVRMWPPDLRT